MKLRLIIPFVALTLNACIVVDESSTSGTPKPNSSAQNQAEEKPSTAAVPENVTEDCLAALRKQVGSKGMKVISARRGEASFIVDVRVDGVPNPWRCYHDGNTCTGTEYQGEG
jgi:hypothetical protein